MIYLIGSLKNNAKVIEVTKSLIAADLDVFSQWVSAGPEADDYLRDYFTALGLNFKQALQSAAAKNIFEFDKRHLEASDTVVLMMPAGKSGFLELGWAIGKGKKGYILFDGDPERIDIMFQFVDCIVYSVEELIQELKRNAKGL